MCSIYKTFLDKTVVNIRGVQLNLVYETCSLCKFCCYKIMLRRSQIKVRYYDLNQICLVCYALNKLYYRHYVMIELKLL